RDASGIRHGRERCGLDPEALALAPGPTVEPHARVAGRRRLSSHFQLPVPPSRAPARSEKERAVALPAVWGRTSGGLIPIGPARYPGTHTGRNRMPAQLLALLSA